MSDKQVNFKEKLRQALASTARVISDDIKFDESFEKNKSSKKFD